jgi:hypothetical protein
MNHPAFGLLDLVGGQLDKHRERLGPFHRPLYLLSGAAAFLLIFAVTVGLPLICFDDLGPVAVTQVLLVALYFMLLLTIRLNVFDRFVYALILTTVAGAAPVLITSERFLGILTEDSPDFLATQPLPKVELFLYALERGLGSVAWALPLLFYFFTFYPLWQRVAESGRRLRLRRALLAGAVLQGVATAMILWQDSVVQRATASTTGALSVLAREIARAQWAYLLFTGLCLFCGFATLATLGWWRGASDQRVHLVTVTGMLAAQLAFAIATHHAARLNTHFPASRSGAGTVSAYEDTTTGRMVFTHPFFRTVSPSKLGNRFQPIAACVSPPLHRFTYRIEPAENLRGAGSCRFKPVSLAALLAEQDAGRRGRTLFCQPESLTP